MAKCANCSTTMLGGIKKDGQSFCSENCEKSYIPPATTVVCGKCGTSNSLDSNKCVECDDYLHQYKVKAQGASCPNCSEPVARNATLCPHCKKPIYSHNKQSNAMIGVVVFIVLFIVIYFAFSSFVDFEAKRKYQEIMQNVSP